MISFFVATAAVYGGLVLVAYIIELCERPGLREDAEIPQ